MSGNKHNCNNYNMHAIDLILYVTKLDNKLM